MDIAEKLKEMAEKGDSLAAYYLGKHYYSDNIDINQSIYWLIRSSYGEYNSAVFLLKKLQEKYPKKVKEVQRKLQEEYIGNDVKNIQSDNH